MVLKIIYPTKSLLTLQNILNMVSISHSDFYQNSVDLCGCSVTTEAVTNKSRAFKHNNLFPRIGYRILNLFYVTFFQLSQVSPQYIQKQIIVHVSYKEDRSLKYWERMLCCYNRNRYTVWLSSFCQNFPISIEKRKKPYWKWNKNTSYT